MNIRPNKSPLIEMIGRTVHDELWRRDWNEPLVASIDELGLSMGTHVGLKRTRNEDRLAVARVKATNGQVFTVAILCDGVGGSESGDHAATLAIVSVIRELYCQASRPPVRDLAERLIRSADDFVRQELDGRGTTTLCMFLACAGGDSVCAGVGDSRIYYWAPSAALVQVTTDDTVENELKGIPGDHDALLKARGLKGRLSQAIGEAGRTADELQIQIFARDRSRKGILLGSDGLWKAANDFGAVMLNAQTANEAVRRGIALSNWVGGLDNSSIIAIDDLEKFCNPISKVDGGRFQRSISIWIGATKFHLTGEPPSEPQPNFKVDKSRRKSPKSKQSPATVDEPQLDLTEAKNVPQEPKPLLEITLGSSIPKK